MSGGDRQPSDIAVLTGIRALAAWWVVAYHTKLLFAPWASKDVVRVLAAGDLAVDLFFVLSGFVIYLNYNGRVEPSLTSAGDFIVRRVARIYPLHLLLLLATIGYVAALYVVTGPPLPEMYAPSLLPLHFLLIQGWGLTDTIGWNYPSWSISTELLAYSLFPLVALFGKWQLRPTWALIAICAALLVCLHFFIRFSGLDTLGEDIPRAGLVRCLTQFMAGTIVCEIYFRIGHHRNVVALLAVAAAAMIMWGHVALGMAESCAMPTAWVLLVLGLACWPLHKGNILASRPLVYLGEISYSTYLVHVLAYAVFKLVAVEDRSAVGPGLTALFFALVLLLSILLYHGFERPAQRKVLGWWKQRSSRRAVLRAGGDEARDIAG